MKKILLTVLTTLALAGCGGIAGIQEGGKSLAEKQCNKSETRRLAERLAVYYATDEVATVKVLCPGDKELAETRAAAETAKCVFDTASSRNWNGASQCLAELMANAGISPESALDADGCFIADGWRICPRPAPQSEL